MKTACNADPRDGPLRLDFDEDGCRLCNQDDDNDGVADEVDYYPLDPTRSEFGGQRNHCWWWSYPATFFGMRPRQRPTCLIVR